MANQEYREILKEESVEAWNQWRIENKEERPNLSGISLFKMDLRGADLSGTDLLVAILFGADLRGADLSGAHIGWTLFGDLNLSDVKGLETVKHIAPSFIGIDTIYRSKGDIPEVFLRGVGVDDDLITYIRSLVGKPSGYHSCFICYSSQDQKFVDRLYADLQDHNVRCWYMPEDMKIGGEIRSSIDKAIHIQNKTLIVLSEHSVTSWWVKKEVETAFEKERQQNRTVLLPIRLDEAVMQTEQAWAADIRRRSDTPIHDFRGWKESNETYQKAFTQLLHDLKVSS